MKPPAKSAHTLQDIARETGFSISTISRALAGNTAISEDTREVVLAVAARCGYEVPQRRARRLPMQVCDQINVVLPVSLAHGRQLANPFELALIGGSVQRCASVDEIFRSIGRRLMMSRASPIFLVLRPMPGQSFLASRSFTIRSIGLAPPASR